MQPATSDDAARYELLDELGAGGMGTVYRALDTRTSRSVALKVLKAELVNNATAAERFTRELRALARLSHPNIVQLIDFGTNAEGTPFLVMELAAGESLAQVLADGRALTTDRVIGIGRQLAGALAAAHEQGVVHRDVKPANIVLQAAAGGGSDLVKLLDFGVSRVIEDTLDTDLTGDRLVGTPSHVSPEQARGEAVDARSDLYSLGVVLYHALTGEPPFAAETPMGLLYHHVHTPPVELATRVPVAPRWLSSLVMELLAKQPEDRPSSALAVVERIETNASTSARPLPSERNCSKGLWAGLGAIGGALGAWAVMALAGAPPGDSRPAVSVAPAAKARAPGPLSPPVAAARKPELRSELAPPPPSRGSTRPIPLSVDGKPVQLAACESGQRQGFAGVNLKTKDGVTIRLVALPSGYARAFLFDRGSKTAVALGVCGPLSFQRQTSSVDTISNVEGSGRLSCAAGGRSVAGDVAFSGCH